jgi:phage FluMu protein Com
MFRLEKTYGYNDVKCPKCGAELKIKWSTEYGDPLPGDYDDTRCPECAALFKLTVETDTTYITS